jgi:hypothetical protein
MRQLPKTLNAPEKPHALPADSKWLAGEGAGSWFCFSPANKGIQIQRFSPQGELECKGVFQAQEPFDLTKEFTMDYPSHCMRVTVLYSGSRIYLENINTHSI